jgi:hypothetical protein
METIAHLGVNLAGIDVVGSAKGETVIQENAAVGYIGCGQRDGKALPETLAEGQVKRRMAWQMRGRRRAVGETRSIVDIGGGVTPPWQVHNSTHMQSVSLIVVERSKTIAKGKIGETAVDVAETESQLIRIGHVDLSAIPDSRGAQGQFPATDTRALDGDGEENVRVIEIVVIKEIRCAS